jgi:hypothetical protein
VVWRSPRDSPPLWNQSCLPGHDNLREGEIVYLLRKNIKIKRPSDKLNYTKLGLFKIIKKLGLVIFKLKIPEGIRIYPVFYISLLESTLKNARLGLVKIDKEI